jgi:hypothetical protein
MADTARIRIKVGHIEIEYEGDAAFLKKDLLDTLKEVQEIQKKHGKAPSKEEGDKSGFGQEGAGKFDHSTDTISTITKVKSGTDLAVAAAAHLHFVKSKPKFSRSELIAEMRTAPSYFKESFVNNMTTYLTQLTKGTDRLRLVAADTYALSNKERQQLETKLAES